MHKIFHCITSKFEYHSRPTVVYRSQHIFAMKFSHTHTKYISFVGKPAKPTSRIDIYKRHYYVRSNIFDAVAVNELFIKGCVIRTNGCVTNMNSQCIWSNGYLCPAWLMWLWLHRMCALVICS